MKQLEKITFECPYCGERVGFLSNHQEIAHGDDPRFLKRVEELEREMIEVEHHQVNG